MRKLNIAILMGGDSEERVISIKTATVIQKHLHSEKMQTRLIDIAGAKWIDAETQTAIDKNDFSLKLGRKKIKFDVVFAAIHGAPLENGALQGYFDTMHIPYTCCNGFVAAMTMNKHITKAVAATVGTPMAKGVLIRKGEVVDATKLVASLGGQLPIFVKPNTHGSSFGVSKVKQMADLQTAIDFALGFDDEVLAEQFMPGREFGQGAFQHKGKVVVLPVTEIIPKKEFFDYEAKYEGASVEVTPAQISPALTKQATQLTKKLYAALGCSGVVRFDYILVGDTFQMLEVNTIPGMSEASIVPQQVVAYGWSLSQFFTALVLEAVRDIKG
jgi:D-alanine-D-alanine ligase